MTAWAKLEKVVGAPDRLDTLADDVHEHFTRALRGAGGEGDGGPYSRRIAAELTERRRERFGSHAVECVIVAQATDPPEVSRFRRSKVELQQVAKDFKAPEQELRMVVARDMWLTGFDAAVLHTPYIDQPMRDHGLLQAIARAAEVRKITTPDAQASPAAEQAMRQFMSEGLAAAEIVDVLAVADQDRSEISVLFDEFLDSIATKTEHPNVQIRLLEKLLKGEVRSRSRTNRTQAKLFSEQIEAVLRRYELRQSSSAEVVERRQWSVRCRGPSHSWLAGSRFRIMHRTRQRWAAPLLVLAP